LLKISADRVNDVHESETTITFLLAKSQSSKWMLVISCPYLFFHTIIWVAMNEAFCSGFSYSLVTGFLRSQLSIGCVGFWQITSVTILGNIFREFTFSHRNKYYTGVTNILFPQVFYINEFQVFL
jgi:hypothetical protein